MRTIGTESVPTAARAKGLVPSGNRDRDAPMTIRTNAGREQPMRPLFHPSLVNGRYGDPAVYVETLFERRGLLFDLGEIASLPPRRNASTRSSSPMRISIISSDSTICFVCSWGAKSPCTSMVPWAWPNMSITSCKAIDGISSKATVASLSSSSTS